MIIYLPVYGNHECNEMVVVHSCPPVSLYSGFVAAFAAARNLATAVGINWFVRTFLEGLFAAGKNSSTNAIHSALSTHESGSPAEAMR
jgi:hypothetical protein